mmetsp:Transcript_10474/g.13115  ORF Transcript_10474/g.13115 Transcript_10474/m.13115 type:complete len:132 (-) Transcript_10474:2201-2596(-)|eukprot:CAMPEP_0204859112 /NCGR_PEP_ID=MMETSP1347-20130617/23494_1 /ASSEMBLY_ACC=CAM_ASM_000690 /TAXON_ID=215587 /ORGANISM="Aplanochytrium stocchinoi, Strain GSBS06" /LENGTH=131 /DNA_ID=CAMNT_0052007505 /DNA_START=71 /DNA_END=466 /DNA_ORIENTATION=+
MLSDIYKAQQARRLEHRRVLDSAKADAIASAEKVNRTLMVTLNRDVQQVHSNQQRLENSARVLQEETSKFLKGTNKWLKTLTEMNEALKQIGDVDAWAENIESQLSNITTSLEYIAKVERTSSVSTPDRKS